jgi:hypothetical protein
VPGVKDEEEARRWEFSLPRYRSHGLEARVTLNTKVRMSPTADTREPAPSDRSAAGGSPKRSSPKRVALAGLWTFLVAAVLVLSPLALGSSDLNRYLVAFGFVGLCVGLSIMLHGVLDLIRPGGKAK